MEEEERLQGQVGWSDIIMNWNDAVILVNSVKM